MPPHPLRCRQLCLLRIRHTWAADIPHNFARALQAPVAALIASASSALRRAAGFNSPGTDLWGHGSPLPLRGIQSLAIAAFLP
jgi:hypothetical protein